MTTTRFRPKKTSQWGLALVATGPLAISMVMLFVDGELFLWVFPALLSIALLLGAFGTYLELGEEVVKVRNLGFVSTLPLANVVSIEPGYWGTRIEVDSGEAVICMAVQKANGSVALNRSTRADRITAEVESHVARARARQVSD